MTATANRPRILLADDDHQVRGLVCKFLKSQGMDVLEAEHGGAAWSLVQQHAFDLVITDTHMPVLGGPELVGLLRARHPGIPILCFTGESARQGESWKYPENVPCLEKPFDLSELRRMVYQLLPHQHPGG